MKLPVNTVEQYFALLRERESIRLKKLAGAPWPWTKDPILQAFKFTNVKREHDRTSQLLITEFYQPHYDVPREQLLLNCALARYFGTIEFMRAIGWQERFRPNYLIRTAAKRLAAGERVYTGAYIITSGNKSGPKEETVVNLFLAPLWRRRRELCQPCWANWQPFVEELMTVPGFGGSGFMAKEVTLDLRYTSFFPQPPLDVNYWTPIGPGSMRGAGRVLGFTDERRLSPRETREVIAELFDQRRQHLPPEFVRLELHDVQFQLCEWDKYERTRLGQGRPRSRYTPPPSQGILI